jgi:PAS domain S-box-containing protein
MSDSSHMSQDTYGEPLPDADADNDLIERPQSPEVAAYWLKAVVESADDAVITKTLDGVITSWNPGAQRVFGYTADEVIGKPVTILFPPDRIDEEPAILARIRAGERVEHYETVRRRKDGTLIDISLTVSPIRDANGRIIGASKVARDITKHRRAQETLDAQAEVISQAYDAIFLRDASNRITLWNRGAERTYGYTEEEALGRSPHDLLKTVPPIPLEDIYESLRRDGFWEGELLHTRKDGGQIVVESRWATVLDSRGGVTSVLEITRDVTERRRAEARLRQAAAIVENSDDAIISKDLDGVILSWNPGAERLYGYTVEEAVGQPVTMLIPEDRPDEEPGILERIRRGERIDHYETVRRRKDGTIIDVSLTVSPIRDANGRIIGASKIARDITETKRAAAERERLLELEREAREEAESTAQENERLYRETQEANRLKDEFLATVSHELRTPLTAILGWAHMLRTGQYTGDSAASAFETIERNARAQAQLIDDLLDVSRIITGKLRIDVRPIDPNSFIDAAVEAVRPAAEAKGIRLQKVLDTGVVSVSGDPVRLQQVVWNLLSNAIKFTPKGGRVQVRMERVNSHIEVAVRDTGVGIPSEFLPHVFDRFRQADMRITRQHGGLGLGLSIVRHLVELHGGTVRAESAGEGHGSTFTVLLPIAPVYSAGLHEERVHPAARETLPAFGCPDRLDGLRVLVVDDEQDTREMLKAGLGQCGAEVSAAGSAAEALEEIRRAPPDMLISDIGMPDEDGYALLRKVRALPADEGGRVPAIALTAYARTEDRLQALRAGYQMHVTKPVELTELAAVVASLAKRER